MSARTRAPASGFQPAPLAAHTPLGRTLEAPGPAAALHPPAPASMWWTAPIPRLPAEGLPGVSGHRPARLSWGPRGAQLTLAEPLPVTCGLGPVPCLPHSWNLGPPGPCRPELSSCSAPSGALACSPAWPLVPEAPGATSVPGSPSLAPGSRSPPTLPWLSPAEVSLCGIRGPNCASKAPPQLPWGLVLRVVTRDPAPAR